VWPDTYVADRLTADSVPSWRHPRPPVPAIPEAWIEHRAVLYTREHQPFSELNEVYPRQLLAFPPLQ